VQGVEREGKAGRVLSLNSSSCAPPCLVRL
jgi:hypothetical protein